MSGICYEHGGVPATSCRGINHKWHDPYTEPPPAGKTPVSITDGELEQVIRRAYRMGYIDGSTGEAEQMPRPDPVAEKTENLKPAGADYDRARDKRLSETVYDQSAGNYGQMIRRAGTGFDTGDGNGDPLVQEPKR